MGGDLVDEGQFASGRAATQKDTDIRNPARPKPLAVATQSPTRHDPVPDSRDRQLWGCKNSHRNRHCILSDASTPATALSVRSTS
jgi:hypothetical protein